MNYNKENPFTLGQVLSITHEVLMCDVSGLYTILNHMTGQSLYTHQLPRAGVAAAPTLKAAFPELAAIDLSHVTKANVWNVLEKLVELYGDSFDCPKLEGWTYEDPIDSALAMMGKEKVTVVEPPPAVAMDKVVTYFGQPMRVACDKRCDKAWGMNSRPKVQHDPNDPDDYSYVPDGELGTAPVDPGTYEGDHAKPVNHEGIPNKWCVRECERCYRSDPGRSDEAPQLPDFDRPEANMPKRRMTGNGR